MTLLAAFQALLHRYSGQDDIVVGSPIANRNRAETEGLIGFFVNMLALRTDLSGDPSFRALLGRVREVALGAFEHQDLPLELLIEALQPQRDLSRTPLFQVMFVLQNNRMPDIGHQELTVRPLTARRGDGDRQVRPLAGDGGDGPGPRWRDRVQHRPVRRGDDRADGRPLPGPARGRRRGPRPAPLRPPGPDRARAPATARRVGPGPGGRVGPAPASPSSSRRRRGGRPRPWRWSPTVAR